MKSKNLLAVVFLLSLYLLGYGEQKTNSEASASETVTVLSTAQMYPLASAWEQQFNAANTGTLVKVGQLDNAEALNATELNNGFAIVSEADLAKMSESAQWMTVVGREIIVPVIHANHPYWTEIQQKGISKLQLQAIMNGSVEATWGNLLGTGASEKVGILLDADGNNALIVSNFIAGKALIGAAEKVVSKEEFMTRFDKNKMAIGFCRLNDVVDESNQLLAGIQVLPFDYNGNGLLEKVENIYSDGFSINRGAWIGKYPKELISPIYVVASTKTLNASQAEFVKWLVTSGQSIAEETGISALVPSEVPSKLSKIVPPAIEIVTPEANTTAAPYIIAGICLILLIVVFFEVVVQSSKRKRLVSAKASLQQLRAFNIQSVKVPKGIYFDRTHTWAFREKEGMVRIGLDDFMQKVTGPFTRVLLKDEGEKVQKGEPIFTIIQEGKQLNICSPVSGVIKSFNADLLIDASLINSSPYDEGWVYVIEPGNWNREVEFLRVAEKYSEWLKSEFTRLKDFIAQAGAKNELEPATLVLQDGGDVVEHVLYQMKPEVWEDFQTNFLDNTH